MKPVGARTKYYINKVQKIKECGMCGEHLPFERFSVANKKHGNLQPYCKPCRSKYTWQLNQEKLIAKNPELFHDCDNCGFIWRKTFKDYCIRCKDE